MKKKIEKITIEDRFDLVHKDIDDLAGMTARQFAVVDERFDRVDQRFDDMDARFSEMKMEIMNNRRELKMETAEIRQDIEKLKESNTTISQDIKSILEILRKDFSPRLTKVETDIVELQAAHALC